MNKKSKTLICGLAIYALMFLSAIAICDYLKQKDRIDEMWKQYEKYKPVIEHHEEKTKFLSGG